MVASEDIANVVICDHSNGNNSRDKKTAGDHLNKGINVSSGGSNDDGEKKKHQDDEDGSVDFIVGKKRGLPLTPHPNKKRTPHSNGDGAGEESGEYKSSGNDDGDIYVQAKACTIQEVESVRRRPYIVE